MKTESMEGSSRYLKDEIQGYPFYIFSNAQNIAKAEKKISAEEYESEVEDIKANIDGALQQIEEEERKLLWDESVSFRLEYPGLTNPEFNMKGGIEGNIIDVGLGNTAEQIISLIKGKVISSLSGAAEEPEIVLDESNFNIIPGPVTLGEAKRQEIEQTVNTALQGLTPDEKDLLLSNHVNFQVEDVEEFEGHNQPGPAFYAADGLGNKNVIHIGTKSSPESILAVLKFAVTKINANIPKPEEQTLKEDTPIALDDSEVIPPGGTAAVAGENIELVPEPVPVVVPEPAKDPETPPLHPEPDPVVVIDDQNGNTGKVVGNEIPVLNWKESDEWKKVDELRREITKEEIKHGNSKYNLPPGLMEKKHEYENARQSVAEKIKESMRREKGLGPLTQEEQAELDKAMNEVIWNELVVKEHGAYIQATREERGNKLSNKLLEGARNLLSNKAVNWYMSRSKLVRWGITTALVTGAAVAGSMIGGLTAGGALTYGGYRIARGAASFATSGIAAKVADKRWSPEKLEKKREEDLENIKNSEETFEEKSAKYKEKNKEFDKQKTKAAFKKAALTFGAGAGAGLLAGAVESLASSGAPRVGDILDNKPSGGMTDRGIDMKMRTSLNAESHANNISGNISSEEKTLQNIFPDPTVLKVEVKSGDSFWKILDKTLENNKDFASLDEVQKQHILSSLTNKAINDPEKYGLVGDSDFGIRLETGKQADLSQLFDENEFKEAIAKAKNLTPLQHANIEANSAKIQNYVKNHPGEAITNDKVSEILSGDTVQEVVVEPDASLGTSPEDFAQTNIEAEGLSVKEGVDPAVPSEVQGELPDEDPSIYEVPDNKDTVQPPKAEDYRLKASNESIVERSMKGDASLVQAVDPAFKQGIDKVYGSAGFLGIGRVLGVESKPWGLMKGLNASEVVKYYTGDSMHTKFPLNVAKELADNEKHHDFAKQMLGLMGEAGSAAKPYEGENVEPFLKRIVGVVMKKHLDKVA